MRLRTEDADLVDHVYDALLEALADLTIEPDARINVDQVARDLAVSPTPVREALARLQAEELVIKRQRSGFVAAPALDRDDLVDLFDVRMRLEPWLAAEAAGVAGRADLDDDPGVDLHDSLALVSGHGSARRALRALNAPLHVRRHYTVLDRPFPATASQDEHERIHAAVVRGDADRAARAMEAHLVAARARLLTG